MPVDLFANYRQIHVCQFVVAQVNVQMKEEEKREHMSSKFNSSVLLVNRNPFYYMQTIRFFLVSSHIRFGLNVFYLLLLFACLLVGWLCFVLLLC